MPIIKRATLGVVFNALRCTFSSTRVSYQFLFIYLKITYEKVMSMNLGNDRLYLLHHSWRAGFALYSVIVFNCFKCCLNLNWLCECSPKQNCALLSVYGTSSGLHMFLNCSIDSSHSRAVA